MTYLSVWISQRLPTACMYLPVSYRAGDFWDESLIVCVCITLSLEQHVNETDQH